MEGVTDFATRLWFAKVSAPTFCWTPFYRATYTSTHVLPRTYAPELFELKGHVSYELIPQVMTGEISHFNVVAETLLKSHAFVDLNCGCPSSTVVGRGSGSSVLETVDKFASLVEGISACIGAPQLSVKMRLGYNHKDELPFLLEGIRTLKLKRVTIHGRTRPQRYTGEADWLAIAEAANKQFFPIVGSGDIFSYTSLMDFASHASEVKDFIIGRGAMRNPWIFSEIRSGHNISANIELIIYALATFAVLHELQKNDLDRLFEYVRNGIFTKCVSHDKDAWKEFFHVLHPKPLEELVLSPFAFSRLKLIWNSLRTSLPDPFWIQDSLRVQNFSAWVSCVRDIARNCTPQWTLQHRKEWDWKFSGQKKCLETTSEVLSKSS